jgi:valyl-tRNA synthetase
VSLVKGDGSGCFCDLYIEMIKPIMNDGGGDTPAKDECRQVLWTCLECYLRLLHPFMPFVTEELYHRLPRAEGPSLIQSQQFSIMIAPYPQVPRGVHRFHTSRVCHAAEAPV